MSKRKRIMSEIWKMLVWLLFLLLPVGFAIWSLTFSPWWMSLLAALGVTLLEALLIQVFTVIAYNIKKSIGKKKINK